MIVFCMFEMIKYTPPRGNYLYKSYFYLYGDKKYELLLIYLYGNVLISSQQ